MDPPLVCVRYAGIGQGRITNNLGTFVEKLDGALHIADEKSIAMVYDLLDTEGLYVGASSALNVVAAYELALQLGPGTWINFYVAGTMDLRGIYNKVKRSQL